MNVTTACAVGRPAPAFRLADQNGVLVSSAEILTEKSLLVVFFPFAFSGICTGELSQIRDDLGSFVGEHLQVVAISCDSVYSLRAWADAQAYFFPILSDFWPHGETARAFGVFDDAGGCALRGTFLIDTTGVVRWSQINPVGQARDLAAFPVELAALR